jgi:hypothetical protein
MSGEWRARRRILPRMGGGGDLGVIEVVEK